MSLCTSFRQAGAELDIDLFVYLQLRLYFVRHEKILFFNLDFYNFLQYEGKSSTDSFTNRFRPERRCSGAMKGVIAVDPSINI
jgi:hypothetical protein